MCQLLSMGSGVIVSANPIMSGLFSYLGHGGFKHKANYGTTTVSTAYILKMTNVGCYMY